MQLIYYDYQLADQKEKKTKGDLKLEAISGAVKKYYRSLWTSPYLYFAVHESINILACQATSQRVDFLGRNPFYIHVLLEINESTLPHEYYPTERPDAGQCIFRISHNNVSQSKKYPSNIVLIHLANIYQKVLSP